MLDRHVDRNASELGFVRLAKAVLLHLKMPRVNCKCLWSRKLGLKWFQSRLSWQFAPGDGAALPVDGELINLALSLNPEYQARGETCREEHHHDAYQCSRDMGKTHIFRFHLHSGMF